MSGKLCRSNTAAWPPRVLDRVAVIGAGEDAGAGIAMNFLDAGVPVTLLATGQEALKRGVALIRRGYEAQVRQRRLPAYKYAVRMAFLSTTLNHADIESADLVIEAGSLKSQTHTDA